MGEKWTEITAGRYKRIASSHKPLTGEGALYIQDQVDYLYSAFVNVIARNRGVEPQEALAMADGKVFIGKQAIEVGLVDGVEAFSDLINSTGVTAQEQLSAKGEDMDINELKTKHPEVFAQALAEGKAAGMAEGMTAGKAEGITEGKALGAEAERKRIADVRAQLIPGHEALIDELASDGKTTGPEAAMRIVAAEKALQKSKLSDMKKDGDLGVGNPSAEAAAAAEAAAKAAKDKDFMAEVEKVINEKKVGRGTAVSIVAKEQPELHEAWLASLKPRKEDNNA
jgi:hypothetical protein